MRSRREYKERGSKGGPLRRARTRSKSQGGTPRRRQGMLNMEGPQQIMENWVRKDIRKDKAKNSTEHRMIGRDRGVGKMKRAAEVKQKISDL